MALPNSTTNLPQGVTNVGDATKETMGGFPAPDPTRLHTWFDDFDQYTTADWVISGTAGTGTIAVDTGADGGVLVVTTGGTEDDGRWLQWAGNTSTSVVETFKWEAPYGLWFKCRLKIDDATQSDWMAGLHITDTSPLDAADGFFFIKVDGSTTINFKAVNNAAGTTTLAVGTCPTDTYFTLGYWWNPDLGVLTVYKDDVPVASTQTTTDFTAEMLAVSFGIQTGEGNAAAMSLDYLLASKDRKRLRGTN